MKKLNFDKLKEILSKRSDTKDLTDQELDQLTNKLMQKLNDNYSSNSYSKQNQKYNDLSLQLDNKKDPTNTYDSDFVEQKRVNESTLKTMSKNKTELNKKIDIGRKTGLKQVQKLKEQLRKLNKQDSNTKNKFKQFDNQLMNRHIQDQYYELENNEFEIDNRLARQLNKLFIEIKQKQKNTLMKKGSTVNISKFIQSKLNGNTRIFNKKIKSNGFTIYIVVDQSGSMAGDRIQTATNLTATLYKSLKGIPEIKIKTFGYSSSGSSKSICGFTKIEKLSDVGLLNNTIGTTPTGETMTVIKNKIMHEKNNAMLILITDGSPNSYMFRDGDINDYLKYLVDELKKKKGVKSFGVSVGIDIDGFSKVFGKNYADFSDMQTAKKHLVRIFKDSITDFLVG